MGKLVKDMTPKERELNRLRAEKNAYMRRLSDMTEAEIERELRDIDRKIELTERYRKRRAAERRLILHYWLIAEAKRTGITKSELRERIETPEKRTQAAQESKTKPRSKYMRLSEIEA